MQLRSSIEAADARIRIRLFDRPADASRKWGAVLHFARSSISAQEGLFADRSLFESRDRVHSNLLLLALIEQRVAMLAGVKAARVRSGISKPS